MLENFSLWLTDLGDSLRLVDTHKTKGALLYGSQPDAVLALPSADATPCLWTCAIAIELKTSSMGFTPEHYRKAVRYALQILQFQTWRAPRAAIGVMCDPQHIAFFRVQLNGTSMVSALEVTHWSGKIEWTNPIGYAFFRAICAPSAPRHALPSELNSLSKNLSFCGYGATSTVYSVREEVLKIYLPSDASALIDGEAATLQQLQGTPGVPTVVREVKSSNVKILVMTPVCQPFSEQLTANRILQLLDILAVAESKQLVHTDVRRQTSSSTESSSFLLTGATRANRVLL
eukprot:TRINITY_DN2649_c0_g1_i2.p1 TRINITY_DN2649_c0_g1~~TRINITY_DN2649_c0_g1_i2.p1  ORF type:complete len:289 (-),score=58.55 TRINITY_DN2649_c0_g1_i2:459-1325(-)